MSGLVVNQQGIPLAGATVVVGTLAPAITDSAGHFSVSGASTPFDVTAVAPDQHGVVVYHAVSATQLQLTIPADPPVTSNATVSGSVTGGATPYSSSNLPIVLFTSPESGTHYVGASTSGSFAMDVGWTTSGPTTGSLMVLQPTLDGNGNATGYTGFGRTDNVTLSPGSSVGGLAVTIGSVATSTLGGSVSAPAGYVLDGANVVLQLDNGANATLFTANTSTFGFNVPAIANATYAVVAIGYPSSSVDGYAEAVSVGLAPGTNNASVTLPSIPSLGTPVNQANAVDTSTSFTWTGTGANTVYDFSMRQVGGGLQLDVLTSATSTTLPDLHTLGIALPSNTQFQWYVQALSPIASINEAASTSEFVSTRNLRRNAQVGSSDSRTFTTR